MSQKDHLLDIKNGEQLGSIRLNSDEDDQLFESSVTTSANVSPINLIGIGHTNALKDEDSSFVNHPLNDLSNSDMDDEEDLFESFASNTERTKYKSVVTKPLVRNGKLAKTPL